MIAEVQRDCMCSMQHARRHCACPCCIRYRGRNIRLCNCRVRSQDTVNSRMATVYEPSFPKTEPTISDFILTSKARSSSDDSVVTFIVSPRTPPPRLNAMLDMTSDASFRVASSHPPVILGKAADAIFRVASSHPQS